MKEADDREFRINVPGTLSDANWSLVMPFSLDEMMDLAVNKAIKAINKKSDRI
jgi:4-alpha-glucanotransferase